MMSGDYVLMNFRESIQIRILSSSFTFNGDTLGTTEF